MSYTTPDLLRIVADERRRSVGFDQDAFLLGDRERALNYFKGEMPDIGVLPNRSRAVSTDIADAVETVMPDLIEIFTGGDDVAAFTPQNPEDEQAARQETDYVNHVVFRENDGFMTLYTMFKDALIEKSGIVTWWWGEDIATRTEHFEGKNLAELALAAADGEISDQAEAGVDPLMGPLYDFTLTRKTDRSTVRIMAVAPDDFTVAPDTIALKDTTYCAMRARPRAQDLKAQGFDAKRIDELPAYGTDKNTAVELARDTAGEHAQGASSDAGGEGDLRVVEVVTHFVRLLGDDGTLETWRVVTGGGETVLLEAEKANRINFAAVTPYPVAHRFYGRSLADLLVEVQRIKTVLTRMVLDSGYFALNQRVEVAEDAMSTNTIADLLRNEPGVPIRSRNGEAVRPIASGALSFDAFGALEYFSTVAEHRTGIVRNAQGLNPDTLHDTAKGALALMNAAQKRVRLIARIFAETGIRDLFLGVHATIRENASAPRIARLKGSWINVDPSTWAERNDMTIEVGLGAAGKDFEIAALGQVASVMQSIVREQGGAVGPIVTVQNVYNAAKRLFGKLGIKTPELFLTDPSDPAPKNPSDFSTRPQGAGASAPVDAKLLDVQLTHQREQQKIANDAAFRQQRLEAEMALKRYEIDQRLRVDLANALGHTHAVAPMPAKPGL